MEVPPPPRAFKCTTKLLYTQQLCDTHVIQLCLTLSFMAALSYICTTTLSCMCTTKLPYIYKKTIVHVSCGVWRCATKSLHTCTTKLWLSSIDMYSLSWFLWLISIFQARYKNKGTALASDQLAQVSIHCYSMVHKKFSLFSWKVLLLGTTSSVTVKTPSLVNLKIDP